MRGLQCKRIRLGEIADDERDLGFGEVEKGGDELTLAPEFCPGLERGYAAAVEECW
jgi:hypothetical protein